MSALILPPGDLFSIPRDDREEFARLPDACRREVHECLRVMEKLFRNGTRGIGRAIEEQSSRLAVSAKTLRGYYDLFRKTHDWRVLINRRSYPETTSGISSEIAELWKTLCERNQRKCKPAYRELMRMWERGEPAGLKWPEKDPMTGYPRGCSYSQLMKSHSPTAYEQKLARVGVGAASLMLPKVLSTRAHLRVGQVYMCDDQDYDVSVALAGVNRKIMRPSGFNALCLASACEVHQGYKPTIVNPDGTKQKLRQIDYQWFIVSLLTRHGYREDTGTIIWEEHGTATGGREFNERVQHATGGKVTFSASGLHGQQLAGHFRAQSHGNPRAKAQRETWFNLLRNEMAALPGQTGKDRHHAPEESYGLEIHTRGLLSALDARPDLIEKLQFAVLRWPHFVQAVDEIIYRINCRTEHELEGWAERVTEEFRLSLDLPWVPAAQLLAMDAVQRQVANGLITSTPGLWRVRKLSPMEVWRSGKDELVKVDQTLIPVMLGLEGGRPAQVTKDHQLIIKDQEVEPEPMWFDAALTNGRILQQREEVLAYLNPYQPEALQICDRDGRFLGTAPRVHRECKTDSEALARRYGHVSHIASRLAAPVVARGAAKIRERTKMHEQNAALFAEPETKPSRLPENFADVIAPSTATATPPASQSSVTERLRALT